MIAPALLSLVAFVAPASADPASQSPGAYVASVTVRGGKCSYAIMDVVGFTRSQLARSLTEYHNGNPEIGLVIWVGNGTPQRCVDGAQRAARAAGYLAVPVEREQAR